MIRVWWVTKLEKKPQLTTTKINTWWKVSVTKCYKGKCYKQNHFRFRLKPGPVCWFRKRSELTFLLLSLGATGEQGISCYSSMALLLLTLASSDLKLPRGCWDTSCHIDDSLFFHSFCVLYVVLWVFSGLKYNDLFFFPLFKQIVTSRRTPLFQVAVKFQLMRKWEKKGKKCF